MVGKSDIDRRMVLKNGGMALAGLIGVPSLVSAGSESNEKIRANLSIDNVPWLRMVNGQLEFVAQEWEIDRRRLRITMTRPSEDARRTGPISASVMEDVISDVNKAINTGQWELETRSEPQIDTNIDNRQNSNSDSATDVSTMGCNVDGFDNKLRAIRPNEMIIHLSHDTIEDLKDGELAGAGAAAVFEGLVARGVFSGISFNGLGAMAVGGILMHLGWLSYSDSGCGANLHIYYNKVGVPMTTWVTAQG